MLRNQYNIASALDVIETWIKIAGYPYKRDSIYSRQSFAIYHDMGMKWSIYLSKQYKSLFEDFGLTEFDFDIDQKSVTFSVDTEE